MESNEASKAASLLGKFSAERRKARPGYSEAMSKAAKAPRPNARKPRKKKSLPLDDQKV